VRVGELTRSELKARLARPGLDLDTGPFVVRLATPIDSLADEMGFLYHDFSVAPDGGFVDFHINIGQPGGLRRWWRPQVVFRFDGAMPFEPLPLRMAIPMLEWSLNWCAATEAHQYVTIHSAVVERSGLAIILPGVSGSGKSTLCAALVHRGWRFLSDEFALLRPRDGRLAPWPRPISLKGQSIDLIRRLAPEFRVGSLVRGTEKGTVAHLRPPAESVRRALETAAPTWIVFPTYQAGAPTCFSPVPQARAFFRLADCSLNYELLGRRGFETLSRVINSSDAYDLRYGNLEEALALLDALEPQQRAATGA
jgi:HprK-related kinase A